jgi:hypothetical protein
MVIARRDRWPKPKLEFGISSWSSGFSLIEWAIAGNLRPDSLKAELQQDAAEGDP